MNRRSSVPLSCFQPNHQQVPYVDRGFDPNLPYFSLLVLVQMASGIARECGFDLFGSAPAPNHLEVWVTEYVALVPELATIGLYSQSPKPARTVSVTDDADMRRGWVHGPRHYHRKPLSAA